MPEEGRTLDEKFKGHFQRLFAIIDICAVTKLCFEAAKDKLQILKKGIELYQNCDFYIVLFEN